jgi:hypothetical protein
MNRQLDLDSLYDKIRNNVYNDDTKSSYNYNLDNNSQYRNVLIPKLVELVIKKNQDKNINQINELVITSSTKHIQNLLEKKNINNRNLGSDNKIFDPNNLNTFYDSNLGNENSNFGTTIMDINNFSQNNLDSLNFESSFTNDLEVKHIGQYDNDRPEISTSEDENEDEDDEDQYFLNNLTSTPPPTNNEETINLKNDVVDLQNAVQNNINSVQDQSTSNLNPTFDKDDVIVPDSKTSKKNEALKDLVNLHSSVSLFEKQNLMVVLDVIPSVEGIYGSETDIKNIACELRNRLNIGQISDVYLEFISFHGIIGKSGATKLNIENYHTFILEIPELSSINTVSNNGDFVNNFVIPNDTFGVSNNENTQTDADGLDIAVTTKLTSSVMKLKSSYMCTVDPKTFDRFTVTLKGLKHSTALNAAGEVLKSNDLKSRLQLGIMFKAR